MLQSIEITKFGKWLGQKFNLGKVNFFFGDNESGKTTLFDALVYGLTNPSGTTKIGKRINERYGKKKTDKIVNIVGNIPPSLDADEFINLHTLKAGGIQWDLEKPEWLNKIKQQLFSGGIDPNNIVEELERRSANRANSLLNKPIEAVKIEIANLESNLNSLIQNKNNLVQQEKDFQSASKDRESIQTKLEKLQSDLDEKKKFITQEEEARKLMENKQSYKSISNWKEANLDVEKLKQFEIDRSKDLAALMKSIQESNLQIENKEKAINTMDLENLNSKKNLESTKSNYEKEDSFEKLARIIQDRILQALRSPKMITQVKWNLSYVVIAIISMIVGTALIFTDFQEKSTLFMIGLGCLALGLVFLLFARSKETLQDSNIGVQIVRDCQREWKNTTQRTDFENDTSLDEIRESLILYLNQRLHLKNKINEQNDLIQKNESQKINLQAEAIALRQNLEQLSKKLESFLKEYGISKPEEYNIKRTNYLITKENKNSIESSLRDRYKLNTKDFEDFLANTSREIESATEKGIQEPKLNDAEFQNLKFQRNQIEKELDTLKKNDQNLYSSTENLKAQLDAKLKPLSESILNTQTELIAKKNSKEELEINLEATKLACEIFKELADEASDTLRTLAEEISNSSNSIFSENRKVIIHELKDDKIHMIDKGNSERVIDHLSLGTKDAFYIAAKLSLCNKRDPDLKLFLMDEPFLSLDEERERKTLQVIQDYVNNNGWQLVILSKDQNLKSIVQEIFQEDCNLIDLNLVNS